MKDDAFLEICKNIDPSAAVDREKNLAAIRARLLNENEQPNMNKTKKMRRPVIIAAVVAAVMLFSIAAYAAIPTGWRYLETRVVQGEEFLTDFFIREYEYGTTASTTHFSPDRDALDAAGGGTIIVEVEGVERVLLDELHIDNLQDGLALLEIENVMLPSFLPEGFAFSRFKFPINPIYHENSNTLYAPSRHAIVYFSDGEHTIMLSIDAIFNPVRGIALGVMDGQQGLLINNNVAVLCGTLSDDEYARLGVTTLNIRNTHANRFTPSTEDEAFLMLSVRGVVYTISTASPHVTAYDLVRIAESLRAN